MVHPWVEASSGNLWVTALGLLLLINVLYIILYLTMYKALLSA